MSKTYIFHLDKIEKYLEITKTDQIKSSRNPDIIYLLGINDNLDSSFQYFNDHDLGNRYRHALFYIADHQDKTNGVTVSALEEEFNIYSKAVSELASTIKSFFRKNYDFELISRAPYKINGIKTKNPRIFSIDDFFKIFLYKVSSIRLGEDSYETNKLTSHEKQKILCSILNIDFDKLEKSEGLLTYYNKKADWINATKTSEVFDQIRYSLKILLDDEEVFSEEYKSLDIATESLKDSINDRINEMQIKWRKTENNLFPQNKADKYYEKYRGILFEIISSEDIDTNFDFNWVSPFGDYNFSNEDECVDIDDMIVSLALLALSNYQTDNESALLQKAREKYRTAVKKLIHERFGPTDNNRQDITETIAFLENIQLVESQLKVTEGFTEEMVNKALGVVLKVFGNKNEYFNEDNDHNMTK